MNDFASWVLLLSVVIWGLLNTSCSSDSQSKNTGDKDTTVAIPVEAEAATRGTISAYYSTTATLEADEEAMVVAKVRGIVNKLNVEEGDVVSAGQVLAKLEDEQMEIEASRAKATMDRLFNEYRRNKELYEKKLVSLEQFENSKYEYESQKAAYELAKLNVEYTTIRAPISGVITERLIKVGNMVNTDQQVFKITDFDPLLAVLHVPEHEMSKLKNNQSAYIRPDAVSDEEFRGEIIRISPIVNHETGTFKVTVAVNDPTRQLKPGMFGRVRIVYDTRQNALLIPKQAVMSEDGGNSVYVIRDQMVYRKNIQTGYENGSNIEVLDGLSEQEVVVTIGQSSLQDSSLVQVVSL